MKIIEIVVSPTGQTQVETKGFSGNAGTRAGSLKKHLANAPAKS